VGDLISKKTRYEFREHMVGWVLREIEMEFDAADIACDRKYEPTCAGARRSFVEMYYHTLDFTQWNDVRKVVQVYENVLARLEVDIQSPKGRWIDAEAPKRQLSTLTKCLEKDGFKHENGRLLQRGHSVGLPTVSAAAAALDVPELHRQLNRLTSAANDDPALAIGTAKELVETTCKTILQARGVPADDSADITELVKATRKELGLLPDGVPSAAKGAEVIRRLLSNLGSVAQGLGELRNLYGTGHGRAGASKGLSARHARLAVGSAATLASFLLETHEERLRDTVKKKAADGST
jgi:Abortive infection C-terminus